MATEALDLSRWLGEFIHPETEAAFQEDIEPRMVAHLRVLVFVPGLLYVADFLFDHRTFGDRKAFWILAGCRVAAWIFLAVSGLLTRRVKGLARAQQVFFAGALLIMVTEVVEHHLLSQLKGTPPEGAPFIVLIILAIYMMLPLPLRLSMAAGIFGMVLMESYLLATLGLTSATAGITVLYLLFANGVGCAFRLSWDRIQRRDLAFRKQLEHEVAERQLAEDAARMPPRAGSWR